MLNSIFSAAAFALLMAIIGRSVNAKPEKTEQGTKVLRLGAVMKGLAVVMGIIPLIGFGGLLYSGGYTDMATVWLCLAVTGPFLAFAIYLGLSCANHKVSYNAEGLVVTSGSGKETSMAWDDIVGFRYSAMWGYLTLIGPGREAKISNALGGFASFVQTFGRRTGHDVSEVRSPYGVW